MICRANHDKKKLSKFIQKITHVDDMMIHNFVKYLVQTRLRLWDIKITIFKTNHLDNTTFWLENYYFYISQTKSSLDKIFYKVVYHHIIYMCDFFGEFRRLFCYDLHEFSRSLWFALEKPTLSQSPSRPVCSLQRPTPPVFLDDPHHCSTQESAVASNGTSSRQCKHYNMILTCLSP